MRLKVGLFLRHILVAVIFSGIASLSAHDNLPVRVANLAEDLYFVKEELGKLSFENESLHRENTKFKTEIESLRNQIHSIKTEQNRLTLDTENKLLNIKKSQEQTNKDLTSKILAQMDSLSKRTDEAFQKLVQQAVFTQQQEEIGADAFTDDYPKQGVVYEVAKGDTISGIATKMHSSTKDILNANKISNPKRLKIGQTIFIPQKS